MRGTGQGSLFCIVTWAWRMKWQGRRIGRLKTGPRPKLGLDRLGARVFFFFFFFLYHYTTRLFFRFYCSCLFSVYWVYGGKESDHGIRLGVFCFWVLRSMGSLGFDVGRGHISAFDTEGMITYRLGFPSRGNASSYVPAPFCFSPRTISYPLMLDARCVHGLRKYIYTYTS